MVRALASVLLLGTAPVHAAQWIRMASPHFEVQTDMGERTARRVLARFELARRVLATSAEWREPSGAPARVLLFGSLRDYAAIRPAPSTAGFFQSGADRDYIAMFAGADLDRVILHEYTHVVLTHTSAPLPQWLEEGLAELYSTLDQRGDRAYVGGAISSHVHELETGSWLIGAELAAVDQTSVHYNDSRHVGMFYAQSWALTHMLSFAERYRGKLWSYVEAITAGTPPEPAFRAAFGETIDTAVEQLRTYVRGGFTSIEIQAAAPAELTLTAAEPIDFADVRQSQAEILILMKRDEEARRIYADIAKRHPNSPASYKGLAVIAMRDRNLTEARRLFERAIELGGKDGETLFEYAMLLRDTGARPETVAEYLERAVAASPDHAEAHFLLGIRASDADRFSDAVSHLETATRILPRQAYFWQALSLAYLKLGRREEARASAMKALRAARTDHETQMARGALTLAEESRNAGTTPKRASDNGVITPKSWTGPKGDRVVTGMLIRVDCDARPVRLNVDTPDGVVSLSVANPNSVAIVGGGAARRTLRCGDQDPSAVRIEYIEATKQATAIQFQ